MAYRIKNTFVVELKSPDGVALLEFKKPLTTKLLDSIASLKKASEDSERLSLELKDNMSGLVSVSGLENEDGSPVTVDQVKALELDFQTLRAINIGYNLAVFKTEADTDEKKDSGSA